MKKINNFLTIIFIFAFVLSLAIKILSVWGYNFPFTYDQGRDLVDLRQMVVTHTPRLVGPTTSINGVLLGPFYYYFLLMPFIIFDGNPLAILLWQNLWYLAAVFILWLVLKKDSLTQANITGILLSFLPTGFYCARYFWNANSMPTFTILFIAILIYTLNNRNVKNSFLVGVISGLSLQMEAAFGVLFFPFALLVFLKKRFSLKKLFSCLVGFLVTIVPQAVFEVRHGFIMTKTLLSQFSGQQNIIGPKLLFSDRLPERVLLFENTLRNTNHIPFEYLKIVFLILLILGIIFLTTKDKHKTPKELPTLSLSFFIFSCIFFFLFPFQVKTWYIFGLTVPFIIFISDVLARLFSINFICKILVLIFIFFTFTNTIKAQAEYIRSNPERPGTDPSNLINEIQAVDWVYQEAAGQGFKVYSYLPAIYDYPFQHVFWWYGTNKYHYQPEEISYLPSQPEYIIKSEKAWNKKKITQDGMPIFLIIQGDSDHSNRFQEWQGNFNRYCIEKETNIIDSLKVVKLKFCSKDNINEID